MIYFLSALNIALLMHAITMLTLVLVRKCYLEFFGRRLRFLPAVFFFWWAVDCVSDLARLWVSP